MQLNQLADQITEESNDIVLEQGKEMLMQKSRDVALQCEIYLRAHPELDREDFNTDPVFSGIAVQAVGKTGYTYLHQPPEPERGIGSMIWAHPNPNMVGLDDPDMLRKALGPYFEPFWDIVTRSWEMEETEGFYMWKDADGEIRQKYMAIVPIDLPDRPFLIGATAYVDEFTQRTEELEATADDMARDFRNFNFAGLIGAIVIIGLCISIYGHRLSRRIMYLTEAAERISVGDLEAEIEVKSKDEIGSLADAISRMQDSLRFSIERLRRRR
jgi:HAMP domain-containing protein